MDATLAAALGVFMRWLHIGSVVILIGGIFYAWSARERIAPAFKKIAYTAIGTVLISGIYNYVTKPGFPPHYQLWFGIKMLLVLHILATLVLLMAKPGDEKRQVRRMAGIVISGAAVIGISAYLRWISLAPLVKLR
jgi:hypothetical protein